MPKKSAFSLLGLSHKLFLSAEVQGYDARLLNELAEHPTLFGQMLLVQTGKARVHRIVDHEHPPEIPRVVRSSPNSLSFDAGIFPVVPPGLNLEVESHSLGGVVTLVKKKGKLYANGVEVRRKLSPAQRDGGMMRGAALLEDLRIFTLPNARFLDVILECPSLAPDDWTGRTYFMGTIFEGENSEPCVECLVKDGEKFRRSWTYLSNRFDGTDFVAVIT